jgi:hypothetical protein
VLQFEAEKGRRSSNGDKKQQAVFLRVACPLFTCDVSSTCVTVTVYMTPPPLSGPPEVRTSKAHGRLGSNLVIPTAHCLVVAATEDAWAALGESSNGPGVTPHNACRLQSSRVPGAEGAVVTAAEEAPSHDLECPHGILVSCTEFNRNS